MSFTRVAYLPDPVKLGSEPGYPPPAVRALLDSQADVTCETIVVADLLAGCLASLAFDVLCIPGGFAPNYVQQLGQRGMDIIRAFVRGGGGFVGLCAGAYLGSSSFLSLLPVRVLDVHRWARGCGLCQISFTKLAASTLGSLGPSALLTVRYANGPLLQITKGEHGASSSGCHALAHYETEFSDPSISSHFPPIMAGSPAAVIGRFGSGLVILASPHIEDGPDERAHTPFRNFFRLCSRDSPYQTWCLQGTDLCAQGVSTGGGSGREVVAEVSSDGPAAVQSTCADLPISADEVVPLASASSDCREESQTTAGLPGMLLPDADGFTVLSARHWTGRFTDISEDQGM